MPSPVSVSQCLPLAEQIFAVHVISRERQREERESLCVFVTEKRLWYLLLPPALFSTFPFSVFFRRPFLVLLCSSAPPPPPSSSSSSTSSFLDSLSLLFYNCCYSSVVFFLLSFSCCSWPEFHLLSSLSSSAFKFSLLFFSVYLIGLPRCLRWRAM